MKKSKTKTLAVTALFCAIIALFTAFIKVNTGINEGYLHFGDAIVYLAGCLLPLPYALLACAIGGALADILSGAVIWALPTVMIKMLTVLPFALCCRGDLPHGKVLSKKVLFMPILAGLITMSGYFVAEGIIYDFRVAVASLPFNAVQAVGSALLFYFAAAGLDKVNIKTIINR